MAKRKIQLIAGSTYTISLPKEWVKKNNLKEKDEIEIYQKENNDLIISSKSEKTKHNGEITIDIDDYLEDIDSIIFALYYRGFEKINIHSKTELKKYLRSRIRKAITHMSGTEIIYEDDKKITLRVLLDKSKIDIRQIIYRILLILESSIEDMTNHLDISEIRVNENEIDRLFHLANKIITLSLKDSNILESSNIKNISIIPSCLLMSKKLENIGDSIIRLAEYLYENKSSINQEKKVLIIIKDKLNEISKHILKNFKNGFKRTKEEQIKSIEQNISKIKKGFIGDKIKEIIRNLYDIEEELIVISFYANKIEE